MTSTRGAAASRPITDAPAARIEAVITDVDGTLYRQQVVRREMFLRLLRECARRPIAGWRTVRMLSAYRRAQEELRQGEVTGDLATAQLCHAGRKAGCDLHAVQACVERWMEREPLPYLPQARYPDATAFFDWAANYGLRLGAVSDYPARDKLCALGLDRYFAVVVSAQDDDVQQFKPNPRGLRIAAARLGASPENCLYIGDRAEVDGDVARRAGMRCAILSPRATRSSDGHWRAPDFTTIRSFIEASIPQGVTS